MNSIQKVALYMRLSKEDLDKGNAESESIQNQRMILDEYASSTVGKFTTIILMKIFRVATEVVPISTE